MQPKHIPERSCVACHTKRPKRDLVRVVRTPEGEVKVDPSGRANGRGAYLCKEPACWAEGVARGKLNSAFKSPLTQQAKQELGSYAASLLGPSALHPAATEPGEGQGT
jgi:hypothetical protein